MNEGVSEIEKRQTEAGSALLAARACLLALAGLAFLSGCSMQEEARRIEAVKKERERAAAAMSTDLTGEQIFIRNCNTCHPGGKQGMGPRLDSIAERFPDDASLVKFLRQGRGMMPAQPESALNGKEMSNLVAYVRKLSDELAEQAR